MDDLYELSSETPPRNVSDQRRIKKLEKEIKEMKDVVKILWGKIIGRTYSASRLSWNKLRKAVLYPLNADTGEQVRELRDGTQLSADFEEMLMNKMSVIEKKIDMLARQMEAIRKENIRSQVDSAFETPQDELPGFSDEVFKDTTEAYIFPEQATVEPQVCPPKKSFFASPSIRFKPSVPPAVKKVKTKTLPGYSEHAFIDANNNKCTSNFFDVEFDIGEILPTAATAVDQDVSSPVISNAPPIKENFVPTKRLLICSTSENVVSSKKLPTSSAINPSKTGTSAIFTRSPSAPVDKNHAFASSSRFKKSLDLKPAASKTTFKQKKKSHSSSVLPPASTPLQEESNLEAQHKPFNSELTPSGAIINSKRKHESYAMLDPLTNFSQEVESRDKVPVKPYDLEDTTCDTIIKHKRKIPSSAKLVQPPSSSLDQKVSKAKVPHKSLELKVTPFNAIIRHKRKNTSSALLGPPQSSTFDKLGTLTRSESIPKSLRLEGTKFNTEIQLEGRNPSSTISNAFPLVERSDIDTPPKSPDMQIPTSDAIIKHKRRNTRSALLGPCRTCVTVERSRAEDPQKSLDSESICSDINTQERKHTSSITSSASADTRLKEKYNTKNPQVSHDLEPTISNVIINRETCTPQSSSYANSPTVSKYVHPEVGIEERPSVSKCNINAPKYKIKHRRRNPNLSNIHLKSPWLKTSNESSPPLVSCEEMFDKLLTSTPIPKNSCNTREVQSKPLNVVSDPEDNHSSNQKLISLKNTPEELCNAEFPSQERISQLIQMASASMLKTPSTSSQPDENEQIKPSSAEMPCESTEALSTTRSSAHRTNDAEFEVLPS